MSSNVIVNSWDSLQQNFKENAASTVCQLTFGALGFGTGFAAFGAPTLGASAAIGGVAGLALGAALCNPQGSEDKILGKPAPFVGGQCSVLYDIYSQFGPLGGPLNPPSVQATTLGPIILLENIFTPRPAGGMQYTLRYQGATDSQPVQKGQGFKPNDVEFAGYTLRRKDNLPDNCGNPSGGAGQVVSNPVHGDTINNFVDNSALEVIHQTQVVIGNRTTTLNIRYGDLVIKSLVPFQYTMNIGGSTFLFEKGADGVVEMKATNPDSSLGDTFGDNQLTDQTVIQKDIAETQKDISTTQQDIADNKLPEITGQLVSGNATLSDIKDEVTEPKIDMDMAFIPFVNSDSSCEIQSFMLQIPKGSLSSGQSALFDRTAAAAAAHCRETDVPQLAEALIFSGRSDGSGSEIFSPEFGPEVISLKLVLTEFSQTDARSIDVFAAAGQRKFGSVAFVSEGIDGGGDAIYIYDSETYIPLPRRGKDGRLRLLLRKFISFSVYDTGERV